MSSQGADFDSALLGRHRPVLRYDAQEPYRALAAESICDNPGNLLAAKDGSVIARAGGEGETALRIELLSAYPDGLEPARGDRLDETADPVADARRMQAQERYSNRIYARIAQGRERRWLQYWFWLYYNPKHVLGFGRHEGDWEMIQIGLNKQNEPEVLTYAQHERGERKPFAGAEVERSEEGAHPVVYLAPFSHASYFEAGTHFYPGGTDNPDGKIEEPPARLEQFEAWVNWPGRWGNSRGVLGRLGGGKLGGKSPPGPAHQGAKWRDPDAFHSDSTERKPRQQRLAWRLGQATYPEAPRIVEVHSEAEHLTVSYELPGTAVRRPDQILVTVHDLAAPGQPVLVSHATQAAARGTASVALPAKPERPLVRISAFNRLRQRSDVVEATPA